MSDTTYSISGTSEGSSNRKSDREYIVPVLAKSLHIFQLLQQNKSGLKVDEIHAHTGIAKSTIYRIVRTFMHCHYVYRNERGGYAVFARHWGRDAESPEMEFDGAPNGI